MFVMLITTEFRCFNLASMQLFYLNSISICYLQFLCVFLIDIVMNILNLYCLIDCKIITPS